MPKMKTKKSAAKRYSLTGSGKVKHKKQNLRHILTKRSPKTKRQLRETGYVAEADAKAQQMVEEFAQRIQSQGLSFEQYMQYTGSPASYELRWFIMVSRAMAVFPVWRSPIMSSRCPLPIGIMESMAFRPV